MSKELMNLQKKKGEQTKRAYHSKGLFSPQYPCIAGDIGINEKDKAKQEL